MDQGIITNEVWKDVVRYEGYYQASTFGRVKALPRGVNANQGGRMFKRERILKPGGLNTGSPLSVVLCRDGKKEGFAVHRLILETFVGLCPPGMECRQ